MPLSSVIRPKSIATVVLNFSPGAWASIPRPTVVIAASVVSGRISEIELTKVVLPTAKPPATRSFTDCGSAAAGSGAAGCGAEFAYSIEHLLQERNVVLVGGAGCRLDQSVGGEGGHEHARHADRQPGPGRDLDERLRFTAQREDRASLGRRGSARRRRLPGRTDHALQTQVGPGRLCASTGEHIGPNETR